MPQRVRATACPTCGHANDGGAVKEFEIAEIPVLDPTSFKDSLGQMTESIKSGHGDLLKRINEIKASPPDFGPVLAKLDELNLRPILQQTCEEHPELCQHQAQIDALTKQLDETEKMAQHPGLTLEYLDSQYGSCPNCTKAIDGFMERKGFVKTPVSDSSVPTDKGKTPVATKEKMPWD